MADTQEEERDMAVPRRPPCWLRLKKASEPDAAQLWFLRCTVTRGESPGLSTLSRGATKGAGAGGARGSMVPHAVPIGSPRRRDIPAKERAVTVALREALAEGPGSIRASPGERQVVVAVSLEDMRATGGTNRPHDQPRPSPT